ncbi:MAG: PTS glucose transporter subunit IIA [Ruminococcus sp.]|nr:PTS glucose transporter subunit IIA [Ruminococcus sp.]
MHFRKSIESNENSNVKIITSCCVGEVVPLELLSNDAFSSLILGDGFGVFPSENRFVSPISGVVKDVSDSGLEVTIKSDDGLILIVSVGLSNPIDKLEAECKVQKNERVEVGGLIWEIDIDSYTSDENEVTAAVIVTNSSVMSSFNIRYGKIKQIGDSVMTISAK